MRFIGTQFQTIDPKGRLVLPAKFARALPDGQSAMVLTVGPDPCLLLYPLDEWSQLAESLNAMARNEAARNAVRYVSDHSTEVELDSHGRLTIPREFLKKVAIEREVAVVGLLRYVELWPRSLYEQQAEARRIASKGVLDSLF